MGLKLRALSSLLFAGSAACAMAAPPVPTAPGAGEPPMWHSTKPADAAVMRQGEATHPTPEPLAQSNAARPAAAAGAAALGGGDLALLAQAGWNDRVADDAAIWVSIERQRLYLIGDGKVQLSFPCGTAEAGAGSRAGTNQTPLGWHRVADKIGAGAAWGQVFRSRKATREVWKPGMDTKEDLVLTRILWLEGLEQGVNRGVDKQGALVDSHKRFIYIHGTNGEDRIGQPSSHGCIRLLNDDVITLFDQVPEGTLVLITE